MAATIIAKGAVISNNGGHGVAIHGASHSVDLTDAQISDNGGDAIHVTDGNDHAQSSENWVKKPTGIIALNIASHLAGTAIGRWLGVG